MNLSGISRNCDEKPGLMPAYRLLLHCVMQAFSTNLTDTNMILT